MNCKKDKALVVFLSMLSCAALAASNPPDHPGVAVDAWLTQQSSGAEASRTPQAALTIQREKAVERHLKTYELPIPASAFGSTFSATSGGK